MPTIESTATHAILISEGVTRGHFGPVRVHLGMSNAATIRLADGTELRLSPAIVESIVDQYRGVTR